MQIEYDQTRQCHFRYTSYGEILQVPNNYVTKRHGGRIYAPEKIMKIAEETSSDLLQQLIGAEVNSSSISAIVEDLSRKKMDEYYGN